jgi:hypothetical protein
MYPTWAMEEYANKRLVLDCVSAAKFAPVMVATETKTIRGTHIGRMGSNPQSRIRMSIAHPAALTATDIKPVMLVGAPS